MRFSCAISESSDVPVQMCSLARAFTACPLNMDILLNAPARNQTCSPLDNCSHMFKD